MAALVGCYTDQKPSPQPPRLLPCFICHNFVYVARPLMPEIIWLSYGPI